MKKVLLISLMALSINSFAESESYDHNDKIGACAAMSSETHKIANEMYKNKFKESWFELVNPTDEQVDAYYEIFETAHKKVSAELQLACE